MYCLGVWDGKEVFDALYESLHFFHQFDHAYREDIAMEMLRKKRYDLIVIEAEMLREAVAGNSCKEGLKEQGAAILGSRSLSCPLDNWSEKA